MRPSAHVMASTIIAIPFWPNVTAMAFAFIGGVLIDLDHLIDYFRRYRKFRFDLFWHGEYGVKPYAIPLHSAELMVVLALGCFVTTSAVYWAFACSFIVHMLMDMVGNQPMDYMLYRRMKKIYHGVK